MKTSELIAKLLHDANQPKGKSITSRDEQIEAARIIRECSERGYVKPDGEVIGGDAIKTLAANALFRGLSEISEEGYCAGWMGGVEFDVYRICLAGGGIYGMAEISKENADELLHLASLAGGWPEYGDNGEAITPMDEWKAKYEAAEASQGSGGKAQ